MIGWLKADGSKTHTTLPSLYERSVFQTEESPVEKLDRHIGAANFLVRIHNDDNENLYREDPHADLCWLMTLETLKEAANDC